MVTMLDTYGGTVHYAGDVSDDELVKQRIANVREYLAVTGCNMDQIKIEPGLPGGGGIMARKAMEKQERMDNPPDQSGGMIPLQGISTQ